MHLSNSANRVIDLSRKISAYYETELRRRYPNYPLADGDEENVPPPPEEAELKDLLATFSDELIYQLILLKSLGRGDVDTEQLGPYYESLKDTVGDREEAVSQMMWDKTIMGGELLDGLEELHKHKINVDRIPLRKIKVRKR